MSTEGASVRPRSTSTHAPGGAGRRRSRSLVASAAAAALVVTLSAVPGAAVPGGDPSAGTLDDVPGTTPADLGGPDLADLGFADPTEALSLVEEPAPDGSGAAQTSIPVLVPPGRAGVEPDLALTYDSSAGNGWLGLGWDLDAGAITVDTTFGAPRFDGGTETETYALDGARLHPHAIKAGGSYGDRVGPVRADFVRQVETEFERIVRHGSTPADYHWQVTDKDGTNRWYGGSPDGQGQVLTTADGNAFHWPLTYVEDISGNVMRYRYDIEQGAGYGGSDAGPGVSSYLREITYTGFDVEPDSEGVVDAPPYRVLFLRDGDVGAATDGTVAVDGPVAPRPDVLVDAAAGAPVVTAELLREIQVRYHGPGEADAPGELLGGYVLAHETGPFDKTLLRRVGQFGGDGVVEAWHEIGWHDDVPRGEDGGYDLFGDAVRWDSTTDSGVETGSNVEAESALSTTGRGGGDGGAYIGFNPVAPSKVGSFGGSFNISGGKAEDITTLMDMDGDSLPDRVYVEGDAVWYARNLSTPGADLTQHANRFDTAKKIVDERRIGAGTDLGFDLHAELYPVVGIQIGGSFGFDWADRYFSDVNADGRPDLVKQGSGGWQVYFNVLRSDGKIDFVPSSAGTAVPLGSFSSTLANAAVGEVQELLEASAPRFDSVRRWVAPFGGTVRVTGTATLVDAQDYAGDGVRVMVEAPGASAGPRLFDAVLDGGAASADHDVTLEVDKGQALYFRVHVVDDGAGDVVDWAPRVAYTDQGAEAILDAQGRDERVYAVADDFTTFGRQGGRTGLPYPGEATLAVTLERTGLLTDDVAVVVRHGVNDGPGGGTAEVRAPAPGGGAAARLLAGPGPGASVDDPPPSRVELTYTLDVAEVGEVLEPEGCADDPATECQVRANPDWLELEVVSDSPVDPRSFALDVDLTVAASEPAEGPHGSVPTELPDDAVVPESTGPVVVPSVRVFSVSDDESPYRPYAPAGARDVTLDLTVHGDRLWDRGDVEPGDPEWIVSPAVVTVKRADEDGVVGVVAREAFTVEHNHGSAGETYRLEGSGSVRFDAVDGADHWIEVSVHDPAVARQVLEHGDLAVTATVVGADGEELDESVPVRVVAPDVQGVFPSGSRGWAAAAYNADHPDVGASGAAGDAVVEPAHFELRPRGVGEMSEDAEIPDAPSADSVAGDVWGVVEGTSGAEAPSTAEAVAESFERSFAYFPWSGPDGGPADRWRAAEEEDLYAAAARVRAVRLGEEIAVADPQDATIEPGTSDDVRPAPRVLSVDGDFNVALGLGPASLSGALGGGRTVTDFQDLNGDGFPDIRTGTSAEYTGPRGDDVAQGDDLVDTISTAASAGGGLGGSPVSIEGSERSKVTGTASGPVGPYRTTKSKTRGMNIGLGFSLQGQWTNPFGAAIDPDVEAKIPDRGGDDARGTLVQRALDDVNGDGLPDIVDTWSVAGVEVRLGVGYGYAEPVVWSAGVFDAAHSVSGALSGGFELNAYEFAGGVGGTEGAALAETFWTDVDGDGVLDRMVYPSDGEAPRTTFGAASGLTQAGAVLGAYPSAEFNLGELDVEERADFSRSTSVSGGGDFTISVGPLCLAACYVIINPGVHGGYERSRTVIDMVDMNGDGHLDVVESRTGSHVSVRLNQAGRTNLLASVTNPLGGEIRVDYERTGNTREVPSSLWVMSELEVDDGRPGDGPDVRYRAFDYDQNAYDPLHRTLLGFRTVEQRELDADGSTPLRITRWTYRNGTPFESGLLERTEVLAPATADAEERLLELTETSWELAHVGDGERFTSVVPAVGDPARVALFDLALAPRLAAETFTRYDADGDEQSRTTELAYDALGNAVRVHDHADAGTPDDDTVTVTTYPGCTEPRYGDEPGSEPSWVQVPATVTVYAGDEDGEVLKHRDGALDLCDNAVPIRIVETQGQDVCGDPVLAVTELAFEPYGNYASVRHPANVLTGATDPAGCDDTAPAPLPETPVFSGCVPGEDASPEEVAAAERAADEQRYCVDYEYDPHRFTDVAGVTDSHGVGSSATYDHTVGRPATTTDANGNVTRYCYDALGRLSAIAAPRESGAFACDGSGDGPATVTYHYGLPADGHAWAVARHHDALRADGSAAADTLDTAAFVDGVGRVVQRKRDAQVLALGEVPAVVVEGAVEFDALGREAREWYPVVERATYPGGAELPPHLTTYSTATSSDDPSGTHVPRTDPTVRAYTLLDSPTRVTLPDGSVETITYDIEDPPHLSYPLARVTRTDPLGRAVERFADVRGAVHAVVEHPAPTAGATDGLLDALPAAGPGTARVAPSEATGTEPIVTTYAYDPLARLTSVTDVAGAVTTHAYDMLDLRTATGTPDSGLVERRWTPAGEVAEKVDEVRRAAGTAVRYAYDFDRLRTVVYPDATGDVEYVYGDELADPPGNSAGRVAAERNGAVTREFAYDVDGNVSTEAVTRAVDPFGIGQDEPQPTWATRWTYDSLQRVVTLTYPGDDGGRGEVLTHEYDLGGNVRALRAVAPQHDAYDATGAPVPREDLAITYVEDVGYDEFGELRSTRTGTGVVTTYDRDPDRRFLTAIDTDAHATEQWDGTVSTARELQSLRYSYDVVGNVTDVANTLYDDGGASTLDELGAVPANNLPGPAQHAYTYDPHYRLIGAEARYVDRQEDRTYRYAADFAANGNLASMSQATATESTTAKGKGPGRPSSKGNSKKGDGTVPGTGSTHEPQCDPSTGSGGGADNQDPESTFVLASTEYDAAHPHRLVVAGTRSYTYDANGNATGWVDPCAGGAGSELERNMAWDAEDRLVDIDQGSNDTQYRYDADGERVLERGPGGTYFFVNEHWRVENDGHRYANVFLGTMMVASHRTSPAPPPPEPCDPETEECVCDPATQACACDEGLCPPPPEVRIHFLHSDLQGSLRVATDEVGGVFQYLEYLPSGQTWVAGQSRVKDTPYLYAGGWTDLTYGIVSFGERWYGPREQRFLTTEPLLDEDPEATVGDPSLLAAYTYAASNPLRYVDRDGRAPFDVGQNFEKHKQGTFTVSDATRQDRPTPSRFGQLLLTHDAAGQDRQQRWEDASDTVDKFFTLLRFKASGSLRKPSIRLEGVSLWDRQSPSTSSSGSTATPAAATGPAPGPASPGGPTASPGTGASATSGATTPSTATGGTGAASGPAGGDARPRAASLGAGPTVASAGVVNRPRAQSSP